MTQDKGSMTSTAHGMLQHTSHLWPCPLPPFRLVPWSVQGYDTTIIPLVVMIILMSVAALASLAGLLVFHVRAPFYARPLNYHADVLHQQ